MLFQLEAGVLGLVVESARGVGRSAVRLARGGEVSGSVLGRSGSCGAVALAIAAGWRGGRVGV